MMPNRKRSVAISHPYISGCGSWQSQAGLTLLELMISLSLGLLLLVGIGTIYVGSNQTYRVQEQNARIQESGRYTLEVVGRSLRQAGFWMLPIESANLKEKFAGTPIVGADGVAPAADSVTVQYDGLEGDRDCEGNNVTSIIITADDAAAVAAGGNADNAVVIQDAIRLNGTDLQCDGNLDGIVDHQPLVSNVEDLQLLYGIDTDANQSADRYVDAGSVTAGIINVGVPDWPRVVSVRVCVLIRSEEAGITSSPQKYVNCANTLAGSSTVTTAADSRLRRAFVATFNVRNRVSDLP